MRADANKTACRELTWERFPVFISVVPRFQRIITAFMLAIWLPALSNGLLQYAGLLHERHADHEVDPSGSHEHNSDNHDAADGKCSLSSTHVGVPVPMAVASPFLHCTHGLE